MLTPKNYGIVEGRYMEPHLFGISNTNRTGDNLWGKNQFNSTFPVALACYMGSKNVKAVYLTVDGNLKVNASEISIDNLFNSTKPVSDLFFGFESKYEPYQKYSNDDVGNIDLVVKDFETGAFLRPLEIKLTVLPDSTTYTLDESRWGTELVIRPPTVKYCALGIIDSLSVKKTLNDVRGLFEPVCHKIHSWNNEYEMAGKLPDLLEKIDMLQKKYFSLQKPLLMQPIWKTKGKNPTLADNAFDIFVWSDFALSRLFLDRSAQHIKANRIDRLQRSSVRLARFFYEAGASGKISLDKAYREMVFDHQTDKEFAVSGKITRDYMDSLRICKPALANDILGNIILGGGEAKLSPERRFDQTIYYTVALGKKSDL